MSAGWRSLTLVGCFLVAGGLNPALAQEPELPDDPTYPACVVLSWFFTEECPYGIAEKLGVGPDEIMEVTSAIDLGVLTYRDPESDEDESAGTGPDVGLGGGVGGAIITDENGNDTGYDPGAAGEDGGGSVQYPNTSSGLRYKARYPTEVSHSDFYLYGNSIIYRATKTTTNKKWFVIAQKHTASRRGNSKLWLVINGVKGSYTTAERDLVDWSPHGVNEWENSQSRTASVGFSVGGTGFSASWGWTAAPDVAGGEPWCNKCYRAYWQGNSQYSKSPTALTVWETKKGVDPVWSLGAAAATK